MSSHAHRDDGATPRSLAEALRSRDDASLAALLRARPDLLSPVPGDLTQLATRAGTRASVVRALGRLDRFTLQTAEALAVAAEPTPYGTLRNLLTGDPDPAPRTGIAGPLTAPPPPPVRRPADETAPGTSGAPDDAALAAAVTAALPHALATLREQALVWGSDDALRLVRTARELLTPSPQHPSPTGLGPTVTEATAGMSPTRIQEIVATAGLATTHDAVSAVASLTDLFTDRARMAALLDDAPLASLDVLSRLLWGPPYGRITADPAPPLRWLLNRGLLLPTSPGTVTLPREAALHLRCGRAHRHVAPLPPDVVPAAQHQPHTQQVVDTTAAGQAHTALATVEELLKDWGGAGPGVLRAGGLSMRDLKRTAARLDTTESPAAFWVELAYAAGLLASDDGFPETPDGATAGADGPRRGDKEVGGSAGGARRESEHYAPTPAYDRWLDLPAAERWAVLVSAWLTATRTAGLVGGRDSKDRTLTALGSGLDRSAAPEVRQRVLILLMGLVEGASPDTASLLARLHWERPLRAGIPDPTHPSQPGHAPQPGHSSHPGRSAQPGRSTQPGPSSQAARAGRGGVAPTLTAQTDVRPARGGTPPAAFPGETPSGGTPGQDFAAPSGFERPERPERPGRYAHDEGPTRQPGRPGQPGGGRSVPATATAMAAVVTQSVGTGHPSDQDDLRSRIAQWTLAEAELLGITGRGALSSHGRALLDPADGPTGTSTSTSTTSSPAVRVTHTARAARLLAPLLPEPLDHVLLQADLTAVAPGPLLRPLADMLSVLADVESKGGATVYRFTPGSVRRALDAGQTAGDLHAFLSKHSRTPVPQPLAYLIDDVARRHGQLRVGAASAYLRCDDDAVLGEILADKRAASLRLRRLAPTVLAAQTDPSTLLDGLRAMGFAPAAESSEGDVLIIRTPTHRTPPRTAPEPVPDGPPVPDAALLTAAVRALRGGDAASTAPRKPPTATGTKTSGAGTSETAAHRSGELPRTTSADTLATVQAAVLTGEALWIGYVNAEGAASQRVIAPIRVEGGFVTAFDHTADEVRTYPLHRITGVAELAGE